MAARTGNLTEEVAVVRQLSRSFGGTTILDAVDLTIRKGEFVALLGRSGSGKSTLLRALAGLDHGVAGTGDLYVARDVSVVFQDSRLLPWSRVLDNVALGLSGREVRQRASAVLADVGLAGRENAWPYELSGGEQQRVALARSLVRDPALLLADEPFGALDALTRVRMHQLLKELCAKYEPGVLLVTHDVDEAVTLADRVLVLDGGRFVVDRKLDFHTPDARTYRNPEFIAHREALLAALGVGESGPHKQISGDPL
ncbi:ABC transporter ATP-binding protein [Mycolicibacterium neworleansense]|uniref:ABC transporter-like protein n=1 Tax=Mycolicibacterium neworleansense TaxID=146018 RepID=A0A0H5RVR6_9MYCO|nr:ABC transporter ATP-binding protein [Mycolicibacterium neworleansense]MCV7362443.1 ABC transporter ATP-binding protein [Mycolicibacterium neworleansense]CRZ18033.1 ABC transporter-like protein [Mycolicibacterium neworleansense]